jgi:inner membrane protein
MDNVTHAFAGAAIAECAVPRGAAARTRLAMMSLGVVAANAPDIDLIYTNIVEEPLGYLLHHRGHSHTVPGLVAIGFLLWTVVRVAPALRTALRGTERRSILLIAVALASHVLMDTANGYGTHLFYPFSSRWVYGDAVFVLEPWCWALLATALALNAGRRTRVLIAVATLGLIGAAGALGILHPVMLGVLVVAAGVMALLLRTWEPKRRAAAALIAIAAIFLVMPGVSRVAKHTARTLADVETGDVVDILADANPGVPWCWSVLILHKTGERSSNTLVARRGTLSLFPRAWPASSCASARLHGSPATGEMASAALVWHRRWQIDVDQLRALATGNCRVRAWLQFGRVPFVEGGRIRDLRFETPVGQNFTPMSLAAASGCPAYLTAWKAPRTDVLDPTERR